METNMDINMKGKQSLPHPEYAAVSLKAAQEGMVLLENDGVLPLKDKKVALFGAGAVDTIYGGTGSGARSCTRLFQQSQVWNLSLTKMAG